MIGKALFVFGGVVGLIVGVPLGWIASYFIQVRPYEKSRHARERSIRDWEELTRIERERLLSEKSITQAQLKKYIFKLDEANTRFAELQDDLQQQKLEMVGPQPTYVALAVVVALLALGCCCLIVLGANSRSATTIQNAARAGPAAAGRICIDYVNAVAQAPRLIEHDPGLHQGSHGPRELPFPSTGRERQGDGSSSSADGFVECKDCGISIKRKNLGKHRKKKHGSSGRRK